MSDLIPRRKDVKLKREWANEAREKYDRLSARDPRKSEAQAEMIQRAQEYGKDYRAYIRGEGRKISWRDDGRLHK